MNYIVVDIKNFEDKKPVSGRFFMQKIPNWIAVDASRVGNQFSYEFNTYRHFHHSKLDVNLILFT